MIVELLDEQFTTLALKTEYNQRRRYVTEWSVQLIKQRAHVSFLQYHMAQYKTHIYHGKSIQNLQQTHGPFDMPKNFKQCEDMLKEETRKTKRQR